MLTKFEQENFRRTSRQNALVEKNIYMKLKALSHYNGDMDTRFGDCILLYDSTSLVVYDRMDQEVKNISSDAEKKPEQVAKYTAKDSVFTSLFREPKYLLQLYQVLHSEDHEATEDSIKNVTITNVLLDQYYNDVGFQIGEKIVIT